MPNLLLIPLSLVFHLIVFMGLGLFLETLLHLKHPSFSRVLVFGYVTYFALFECIVLPMIFFLVPLSVFSLIWGLILTVITIFAFVVRRRDFAGLFRFQFPVTFADRLFLMILLICILLQILTVVIYQDTSADSAYYVGMASTSVYTNTLGRFNPYTGDPLQTFPSRYIFSGYPMHNAFVSFLFQIPTIIQSKTVMPVLNVFVANLLYYLLGRRLFPKKYRYAAYFVILLFLFNIMTGTLYTPGTFLFTRTYEGKALLANFSVFFILYCFLWLYQEKKQNVPWLLLFLGNICAISFSGTAVYLPALICASAIPVWIRRTKKIKQILLLGICLLPNVLYTLAYILAEAGILTLSAVS